MLYEKLAASGIVFMWEGQLGLELPCDLVIFVSFILSA